MQGHKRRSARVAVFLVVALLAIVVSTQTDLLTVGLVFSASVKDWEW